MAHAGAPETLATCLQSDDYRAGHNPEFMPSWAASSCSVGRSSFPAVFDPRLRSSLAGTRTESTAPGATRAASAAILWSTAAWGSREGLASRLLALAHGR